MTTKLQQRIEYLNHLLKNRATGTPKELAKKIGLTERGWYKLRDQMINDLDIPMAYCPKLRSYYYTEPGTFEFGFKRLSNPESIKGGGSFRNSYLIFSEESNSGFESFHKAGFSFQPY